MRLEGQLPVVIAAAGKGSRLGFGMPKCLVDVAGRSILDRQLELLEGFADVRIVVGFRADDVRAHVAALGARAQLVVNDEWETTNTLASLELATRNIHDRCIIIDGDLVIDPDDFHRFLAIASESSSACIGITPSGTEDGVYVSLRAAPDANGRAVVTAFHRSPATEHEWSGLAVVSASMLRARDGWVFTALEPGIPLRAGVVRAWEIDTVADLGRAEAALGAAVRT